MNEIDRLLDQICHGVGGPRSLRLHLREELREHLEDSVVALKASGLSEEEAVQQAIAEFGDPSLTSNGFQEVYGRDLVAIMIDRAMEWKEKTMKTKWKWEFVAQTGLVLLLGLLVFLFYSIMLYIVPRATDAMLQIIGPDRLTGLNFLSNAYWRFFHEERCLVWLVPLLLIWALFEWKNHSEQKTGIRMTALCALCLLWTLLLAASVAIVTIVPLQHIALHAHELPRLISDKARLAADSYADMERAVERKDWVTAEKAANQFSTAIQDLELSTLAQAILTGSNDYSRLNSLDDTMDEAGDNARDIAESIRTGFPNRAEVYFSRLKPFYQQILEQAPHWPRKVHSTTMPATATQPID